jgi:hypothetical protein
MFGLAAAPDVAIASPSVNGFGVDEKPLVGRYASTAPVAVLLEPSWLKPQ